jgi:hypothetical protein
MTKIERWDALQWVSRCLLIIPATGLIVAPWFGGWFGWGQWGQFHSVSVNWHPHAKFHVLWQAWTTTGLGLTATVGLLLSLQKHSNVRLMAAAICFWTFSGNVASYFFLSPLVQSDDPLPHHPLGFYAPEIFFLFLLCVASVVGISIDITRQVKKKDYLR